MTSPSHHACSYLPFFLRNFRRSRRITLLHGRAPLFAFLGRRPFLFIASIVSIVGPMTEPPSIAVPGANTSANAAASATAPGAAAITGHRLGVCGTSHDAARVRTAAAERSPGVSAPAMRQSRRALPNAPMPAPLVVSPVAAARQSLDAHGRPAAAAAGTRGAADAPMLAALSVMPRRRAVARETTPCRGGDDAVASRAHVARAVTVWQDDRVAPTAATHARPTVVALILR